MYFMVDKYELMTGNLHQLQALQPANSGIADVKCIFFFLQTTYGTQSEKTKQNKTTYNERI